MKIRLKTIFLLGVLGMNAAQAQNKPVAPGEKPSIGNIEQGIDKMFAALDTDRNKQLSYDEFKTGVVAERRQAFVMQRLVQIFQAADKSGNKALELVEFNALPGVVAARESKPKFVDYDKNKDQKIDFREYVEFASRMSAQFSKK